MLFFQSQSLILCVIFTSAIQAVVGQATYTVEPGDMLTTIASRVCVTVAGLESANPQLTDPNLIYPGQVLDLPASEVFSYVTFPDDYLYLIAENFDVDPQCVINCNPQIQDFSVIYPGENINIPTACDLPPSSPAVGPVSVAPPSMATATAAVAPPLSVTLGW